MKILMIAGGTGGHVFPALTIAKKFAEHGNDISWIGKLDSLEAVSYTHLTLPTKA